MVVVAIVVLVRNTQVVYIDQRHFIQYKLLCWSVVDIAGQRLEEFEVVILVVFCGHRGDG